MDGNTTLIIIVAIFAVVVLVWALLFRKKGSASIEAGPVKVKVEGESPAPEQADAPAHNAPAGDSAQPAEWLSLGTRLDAGPGVSIEDARAGGGILAEDSTGGGVRMRGVEAEDDIIATSSKPGADPKA